MYEDSGFVTEKLTACIYAALCFPENNPAVVAAWDADHSLANLSCYRWQKHCRGLYQTPMAA
jgi:hypothetical protein